jgi:hypothetical protein
MIHLIESGLYIALIVFYSTLIHNLNLADFDLLDFAATNQCADGPLQFAYETLNTDLRHDFNVLATGLFFVLAAFTIHLGIPLW